jgi:hypothetical protein
MLHVDPASLLRGPCLQSFVPDKPLRRRIIEYLAASQGASTVVVRASIPNEMPRWSNVRIYDGDRICCQIAQGKRAGFRDAAFVRVSKSLSSCLFKLITYCRHIYLRSSMRYMKMQTVITDPNLSK